MASNSVQFKLGFTADTSQAQASLKKLQQSLTEIQQTKISTNIISNELNEAADAAKVLQKAIFDATNVDTGKLNLTKFNASLSQSGTDITKLSTQLLNLGSTGSTAFVQLANSIAATEVPLKRMNSTLAGALTTLKNTVKWEISSSVVHGLESALSGAVTYVQDLNESLNNIRIVTGQSVEDMARFAKEANKAAQELSTTTKAYSDAALIYYQQGDNDETVAQKAAITIKAANASFGSSAKEMSEYLTAVWNSYQVGAEELEHYVDIMASLGAKTATSLEEIATSMQKVAATANTVGVSMEQVSSIIATVSSVTRESAESIGTSYKTIFARIGDLKLGKTLEDGASLGTVSSQLQSIGVQILDANGSLRDMGDIITDLGGKWQTMDSATKTAVAQAVAGKRQYTQLMALFENWDKYQKNLNIAENSDGSLQSMADTYAESWEAASARVKASWESIYSSLLNDEVMIKWANSFNSVIKALGGFIEGIGGLPGLLTGLGSVALAVFQNQIADSITNVITKIQTAKTEGESFEQTYSSMKQSLQGFFDDTNLTDAQKLELEYTSQIMALNSNLYKKSKTLTDSQVAGIQSVIAQLEREKQMAMTTAKAIEEIGKSKENSKADMLATKNNRAIAEDANNTDYSFLTEAERNAENATAAFEALATTAERINGMSAGDIIAKLGLGPEVLNETEGSMEQILTQIENIAQASKIGQTAGSFIQSMPEDQREGRDIQGGQASIKTFVDQLPDFSAVPGLEEFNTKITNIKKTLAEPLDQQGLLKVFDELKNLGQDGSLTALQDGVSKFRELGKKEGFLNVEAFDTWLTKASQLPPTMEQLSDGAKKAGEDAKAMAEKIEQGAQKSIQSITQLASGLTGLKTLSSGINNSLKIFEDEDASAAEKFGAALSLVTTLLYGYVSAQRVLTVVRKSDLIQSIKNTVAHTAEGTSLGFVATMASVATAALGALKSTGGLVALALMAVVAIITTVIHLINKRSEEEKKQQELLAEGRKKDLEDLEKQNEAETALSKTRSQDIASYNELLQKQKQGQNVTNDLIEITTKLASTYDLTGVAIAQLTGDYEALTKAAKEAAQAEALRNFVKATTSDMDLTRDAAATTSFEEGYSTNEWADAEVFSGKHTRSYDLWRNTQNQGYGGYRDYNTYWTDEVKLQTVQFSSDTLSELKGTQYTNDSGETLKAYLDTNDLPIEDYILYGGDNSHLMLSENDSYEYREAVYQAMGESLDQLRAAGFDQTTWFRNLQSIYTQMTPDIERAREQVNVAKTYAEEYLASSLIDATDNSLETFEQYYDELYGWVLDNAEALGIDLTQTDEKVRQQIDAILIPVINQTTGLDDYALAHSAIFDAYNPDEDENANSYREVAMAIMRKYGPEAITSKVLSSIEELEIGEDIDEAVLAWESSNSGQGALAAAKANSGSITAQRNSSAIQTAQKVLKQNMTDTEYETLFKSLSGTGLGWDAGSTYEEQLSLFRDFAAMPYSEQTAYFEQLQRESAYSLAKNAQIAVDTQQSIYNDAQERLQELETKANMSGNNWHTIQQSIAGTSFDEEGALTYDENVSSDVQTILNHAWEQFQIDQKDSGKTAEELQEEFLSSSAITALLPTDGLDGYNEYIQAQEDATTAAKDLADAQENELNTALAASNAAITEATSKLATLKSYIDSIPQSAAEWKKLSDLVGLNAEELYNLYNTDPTQYAQTIVAASDAALNNMLSETEARAMYNNESDKSMSYEDWKLRMNTDPNSLTIVSDDEKLVQLQENQAIHQSGAELEYKQLQISMQEVDTELSNIESSLSSVDFETLPKAGTKAYKTLDEALKKVGSSMKELQAMDDTKGGRAQQIRTIGEAQKKNYEDQIVQQQALINKAQQFAEDENLSPESRLYWEQQVLSLTQERITLENERDNVAANTQKELISYYETAQQAQEKMLSDALERANKTKEMANILQGAVETGELSQTDKYKLGDEVVKDWELLATAEDRASFAAKMYSDYAAEVSKAYEDINSDIETLQKILPTGNSASNSWANESGFNSYVSTLEKINKIDADQAGILYQAYKDAAEKYRGFEGMNNQEIMSAVKEQLTQVRTENQDAINEILGAAEDAIIKTFTDLADQNIEKAQQAAEAWKEAFETIAAARQKLLSGGNLLEDIAGDPAKLLEYWRNFREAESIADLTNQIISGSLSESQLTLPAFDLATMSAQYGMNLDDLFSGEKLGQFNYQTDRNAVAYSLGLDPKDGSEETQKSITEDLAKYYTNILMDAFKMPEDEAKKLALEIASTGKGWDKYINQGVADLGEALQASALATQILTNKEDLDAVLTGVSKENENRKAATNNFTDGKTQSEIAQIQAAIERAQSAKSAGNSWDDLSYEDRTLLAENGIDFSNLDTASEDCAGALNQLAQAAEAATNAAFESQGYQKNEQGVYEQQITKEQWAQTQEYDSQEELNAAWSQYRGERTEGLADDVAWTGLVATEEELEAVQTVRESAIEAANNVSSTISENIDRDLTAASNQLTALNNMYNLTQGTDEWEQGLQKLESAYAGMEEAQSVIDSLRAGTISLKEANEMLASETMKAGKSVDRMTDSQYDQWKQMLKNNKVTVKGYKTLEDYFEACDKGRKIYRDMTKRSEDFVDSLKKMDKADVEETLSDWQDAWNDANKDGLFDPTELNVDQFGDFLEQFLPDEFKGISDTLASVMNDFGGDFGAAIQAGFDTATGTFDAKTVELLTAMGLDADQITSLQDEIAAQIANGAQIGDINMLEMIAGMDVDNVPFDSMITALNNAMTSIAAQAAAMGIPLEPPWTNLPTLASKGVGAHGGRGGGNNARTGGGKKGSGGGGGGGGGKKEHKDHKTFADEVDRYHVIKQEMARTNEELDKLDKLKERTYGKNHLKNMDDEISKLKELTTETQRYMDEIQGWLASDRALIASFGAQFDSEGNVKNYEEMLQKWIDEYNKEVDRYNKSGQSDGDKLRLENAEELYERRKKALEQYEETLALAHEQENELLELQNKISENALEKITYKIEVETEINDKDLQLLEYYANGYEDHLDKQGAAMTNLMGQIAEYEDNLTTMADAMQELNEQYANGTLNESDFKEGMDEVFDKSLEYAEQLQDLKKELEEVYENTLSLANEELQNHLDKLQNSSDAMAKYISISALLGRGPDYSELDKFYKRQNEANVMNLKVQKDYVDTLKTQMNYFQDRMAKGIELTDLEKKQYEQLQDAMNEAFQNMLDQAETTLQGLQDAYNSSIEGVFDAYDKAIAGTAGSLQNLTDQYSYFQELQDRNISASKQLHDISKLNRDIENSLADATTNASKERLKALQEEINKRAENNKLTQYDLDMMDLQYQLALKLMALEEMKQSKDTVRLTRDENGNYGYQYTADQDKVAQAQQEYEDVLQQINELSSNRISELEQSFLDAQTSYKEAAQEIANDTLLTEEEKMERLTELRRRFDETMDYYNEQYTQATSDLGTNQEAIANHYGVAIGKIVDTAAGNMNNTIGDMIANTNELKDAFSNMVYGDEGIQGSLTDYMNAITNVSNALTGLDAANAEEAVQNLYSVLSGSLEQFADADSNVMDAAMDTLDTISDSLAQVNDATEIWAKHADAVDAVQNSYEKLADAASRAIKVLAGDKSSTLADAIAEVQGITASTTDAIKDGVTVAAQQLADDAVLSENIANVIGDANSKLGHDLSEEDMVYHDLRNFNKTDLSNQRNLLSEADIAALNESYQTQVTAMLAALETNFKTPTISGNDNQIITQDITINADFPGVQTAAEILAAFEEMNNMASQYINQKEI